MTPIAMVGLLLGWPQLQGYALAVGLVVGAVLELGLIAVSLRRQRLAIRPRWTGWSPELRQVAGQFFPVMAGACVFASSELIDQSMASQLPAGSVAALGYGNKMVSLPLTLMTTAIGTAVMPYFSQLIGQNKWSELHQLLRQMLPRIFGVPWPWRGDWLCCRCRSFDCSFSMGLLRRRIRRRWPKFRRPLRCRFPFICAALLPCGCFLRPRRIK
ncbi:MAG: hypothetical protein HC860_05045 [Alkalinema sp. RU_4_3]|nr:hypothetical protein [Alkalinema sp. RU_4_3]